MANKRFKDWTQTSVFSRLFRIPIWNEGTDVDQYIEVEDLIRSTPQWDSGITYSQYDFISYNNKLYFSLQNSNTNQQPDAQPTWWEEYGNQGLSGVYQNPIINPFMQILQRPTPFTAVADGQYTLDRWEYNKNGSMVHNVSRQVDAPANEVMQYCMKLNCTTADASIAANEYCFQYQKIEGSNFRPFFGQAMTLKFWVKAVKTGTYCVAFRNNANDRSYVAEYTIDATGTWEEKTISLTHDTTGTWEEGTSAGLKIAFVVACGSNFQTTAGSWQTGNYLATSNQVNGVDSTSNDFNITGVQLNLGNVDLPYMPRDYLTELLLCQRYYFDIGYGSATEAIPGGGGIVSPNISTLGVKFPVEMRVIPTFLNAGVDSLRVNTTVGILISSAVSANYISKHSAQINGTTVGATLGTAVTGFVMTNRYLAFDAEL